ncbi:MAG: hypothetical protein HUJ96_05500 [Marinilabiliaceae bacterium]|mgnify:CR=1 FL=1|nr:hypothetical protein [Marinilabiliaceae bacterium]
MILIYLICAIALGATQFVIRNRQMTHIVAMGTILLQWVLTIYATLHRDETDLFFFKYDGLGILMLWALAIISSVTMLHSTRYIPTPIQYDLNRMTSQYYGAMQILMMALSAAYLSSHIAMTWIFIEVTTLSASALIFYRRDKGSVEATWKYVFACSISLVLVYVGILLITIAMQQNAEEGLSFATLEKYASTMDEFWLKMSMIFILVGYSAKMSLFPMFTAGIDAKDKAPTPAAGLLSSVLMNAGFVAFYRFYKVMQLSAACIWARYVVLGIAIVSLFVAAVYLIRVHNVKRLFAYSSVEHMAVAMLGLAAGGIGTIYCILHVIIHSFVKSSIFLHIAHIYRVYGTKQLSNIGRYIRYTGVGTTIVFLATISITAMPPSGLFFTELMIFKSMIDMHWWICLAVVLILLTVIVWAISRDMFSFLFQKPEEPIEIEPKSVNMPYGEMIGQLLLLFIAIWLGIYTPSFVSDLIL